MQRRTISPVFQCHDAPSPKLGMWDVKFAKPQAVSRFVGVFRESGDSFTAAPSCLHTQVATSVQTFC